jgi:uncharacterized membrane protein YfcA
MFIFSLILAFFVGIILGLVGSGGSVLTMPILVYLLGFQTVLATSYSLFIVGTASLIGAISYLRSSQVDVKMALLFGVPSIIGVYITRALILPVLPEVLFTLGKHEIKLDLFIMLLFAALMLLASISMIRSGSEFDSIGGEKRTRMKYMLVLTEGVAVGAITGLVGAGGGFLIIPFLVLMSGMEMKKAVGTSLLIIAAKSLIGFMGDVQSDLQLDLIFLLSFTSATSIGILGGSVLSERISAPHLKSGFGWFILVFACLILLKEILGIL